MEKETSEKYNMLVELGIYELRGLARNVGVPSPTTKKRAELIDEVMKRVTSGTLEKNPAVRQGRPSKELSSIVSLVEKIKAPETPKDFQKKHFSFEDFLVFAQDAPISKIQDAADYFVRGVVRRSAGNLYFHSLEDFSKMIFIANPDVVEYKIDVGDLIAGKSGRLENNKYILNEIESINNIPKKDIGLRAIKNSEDGIKTIPHKNINSSYLANCLEGGRYFSIFKDIEEEKTRASKLISDLVKKGYQVVYLGINIPSEFLIPVKKNLICDKFLTSYEDTSEDAFNIILDAISHAERLEHEGKKVCFVVFDIVAVMNTLDMYFSDDSNKVFGRCEKTIVIIKKIMSITKVYEEGSSITLFTSVYEDDMKDKVFSNEIKKYTKQI